MRQQVHAAAFDLRSCRILVLVDHILVEAEIHQLVDPIVEPRLAKRREILPGVAVEHQLVDDDTRIFVIE